MSRCVQGNRTFLWIALALTGWQSVTVAKQLVYHSYPHGSIWLMPYLNVLLPRAGTWLNCALEVYVIWLACYLLTYWAEGWTRVLGVCYFVGMPLSQLQLLLRSGTTVLEWARLVAAISSCSVALLLVYRAQMAKSSH